LPAIENAAPPISEGTSLMMPAQGARTTPRSRSACAAASCASAILSWANQLAAGFKLHAPLINERARLSDLRLARLVRKNRDHIALLHLCAAAHMQFLKHAAGARRDHDLAVRLRAAGQSELLAMLHHVDGLYRDAEKFLLRFSRLHGGHACGVLVRHEVA
jgi:hypothetical protein